MDDLRRGSVAPSALGAQPGAIRLGAGGIGRKPPPPPSSLDKEHSASGSEHASSTFQNRMRSVIEGPQVHSQVAVDRRLLRRFER